MDRRIMKTLSVLRPKMYSYLTDDGCIHKKAESTRKCKTEREAKFYDNKNCLEKNELILK